MTPYFTLKWLHILSSTVLFGTGIGSAYYLFVTCLQRDARAVAHVAGLVVLADWLFTGTTVLIQPLTGALMLDQLNLDFSQAMALKWVRWSVWLYVVAGAAWLPVVWMQYRMRDLARDAAAAGAPLPPLFYRFFAWWIALGCVAFPALVIVFYLMVAKPA
jgi:uncharacterized membrane protein